MIKRSAQIYGSPALPIGLLSQPPRPLAQPRSALHLPSRQQLSSPSSSIQPQAQATDRSSGQWRQLLELFQNTLPLPSRWVCVRGVQCADRGRRCSLCLSTSTPHPLLRHPMQSSEIKAQPGSGTRLFPVKQGVPFTFWLPTTAVKSKPCRLWSGGVLLFT